MPASNNENSATKNTHANKIIFSARNIKYSYDIICNISKYLLFNDVFAMRSVCKIWYKSCDCALFFRLANDRWSHVYASQDLGMGLTVKFDIQTIKNQSNKKSKSLKSKTLNVFQNLWRKHILIREAIEYECNLRSTISEKHDIPQTFCEKQATKIFNIMQYFINEQKTESMHETDQQTRMHTKYENKNGSEIILRSDDFAEINNKSSHINISNHALLIECCRWIANIFDESIVRYPNYLFVCPLANAEFLQALHSVFTCNEYSANYSQTNDKHQYFSMDDIQLCSKVYGILAINEENRQLFSLNTILIEILCDILRNSKSIPTNTDMVSCILWCLIIFSRPIGGVEGRMFFRRHGSKLQNILRMKNAGLLDIIYLLMSEYQSQPSLIAKIFWLMVNLSLSPSMKANLIENQSISYICQTMAKYPKHKELQYRAIFSIINLGLRNIAKRQILQENGTQLILSAMQMYSEEKIFQRCCLNAIRSLIAGNVSGDIIKQFNKIGTAQHLRYLSEKFNQDREFSIMIENTINCLGNEDCLW